MYSDNPHVIAALRSVGAAEKRLDASQPQMFADYMSAWRRDLDRWQNRYAALGDPEPLPYAVRRLGLDGISV